ncbi:MAG: HAD family hydrolase [Verrucomicrobiales bacterium]
MNGYLRAAIFDLDGTLVDSVRGIALAVNGALADFSLPARSLAEVESFIGHGLRRTLASAAPGDFAERDLEALEARFMEIYRERWAEGTEAFAGVWECLEDLAAAGVSLGVLSNKTHEFTVAIVEKLFPGISFREVWGQREGVAKKPDPAALLAMAEGWGVAPEEAAYVGDSGVDLETARRAGMRPVIVDWGYNTPELREGERLVGELAELRGLFAGS